MYTTPVQILTSDAGEDVQTNACKLLEVIVIQCQGRIDAVSGYLLSSDFNVRTPLHAKYMYVFISERQSWFLSVSFRLHVTSDYLLHELRR